MVQKGYAVLFVGTATFKGTDCTTTDATYDFMKVPTTVKFSLGFATPVSSINCQNQTNQGDAFPNEEYQRGVPILANKASGAQLMYHMDHPFYADVQHEPGLFFNQMAAQLVGKPDGTWHGGDETRRPRGGSGSTTSIQIDDVLFAARRPTPILPVRKVS